MMSALCRRIQEAMQRLLRETRGSIALNFALAVPAVAMLSVGAIDLLAVMSAKTRLQDIADAAALAAAPPLAWRLMKPWPVDVPRPLWWLN